MTATDRHIVRTVLRHSGVADDPVKRFSHAEVAHSRALKTYRTIYASLSLEERMAAYGHAATH